MGRCAKRVDGGMGPNPQGEPERKPDGTSEASMTSDFRQHGTDIDL